VPREDALCIPRFLRSLESQVPDRRAARSLRKASSRRGERGKIDDHVSLRGRTVDAHAISHLPWWLRAKSTFPDSSILFATNIEHRHSRRSPIFHASRDSRRCLAGTPGPLDASMRTIDRRFHANRAAETLPISCRDSLADSLPQAVSLQAEFRHQRRVTHAVYDIPCTISIISAASPAAHSAERRVRTRGSQDAGFAQGRSE